LRFRSTGTQQPDVRCRVVLSQRRKGTAMDENQADTLIVDSAVHLHQALGPGPLESVYEAP